MTIASEINKFTTLTKNTLDTFVAYRASFLVWRLQLFVTFSVFYYLWVAIASSRSQVGSYSIPNLISYFVVGYLVRAIVFSTRTSDLGGDIQSGSLAQLLLKPIGTLRYYFSRDIIDKLFNIFFMTFEMLFIYFVFQPQLVVPSFQNLILFLISLVFATISFFFYSLIISFMSFWSESAWASRFLFGVVIVTLFSGQFIPLDLLPSWFIKTIDFTPFPYFYYYPLRLFLGMELPLHSFQILIQSAIISLILYLLAKYTWRLGLKKYQSYGN